MLTDQATGRLVVNATLLRAARAREGGHLVIVPAGAGPESTVLEIVEQLGMQGVGPRGEQTSDGFVAALPDQCGG